MICGGQLAGLGCALSEGDEQHKIGLGRYGLYFMKHALRLFTGVLSEETIHFVIQRLEALNGFAGGGRVPCGSVVLRLRNG